MTTAWNFGINVVFIVAIVSEVSSLKCLQCHSLHQSLCEEGHMAPNECREDINSTHCVKMEAKLHMGKFVMRYCSKNETQVQQCGPNTINNEHVRVCKYSCQTDGCNSALGLHQNFNLFVMPFTVNIPVFVLLYCIL
ncbi:U-scoloptoxin(05)-Sm1a-like [Gigantopelta aegis]|uniref:U-scoloptoxin(05)-Sm1a-like n=1 Tax=Gigantopelta aegis TaxID=1735272 RepID=UPI001B88A9AF|nr:U-scoloptoxin(05)-Sm1a-like [Gigantopelta aegis]